MTKYTKNPFIISSLFLLFSILFLLIFFNRTSRDSVVEQIQHRQQMSVRAGANSIDTFLNALGKSAVILTDNPDQKVLDSFINMWADTGVAGLVITDDKGVVVKNSNSEGLNSIGVDLSDRDHFKWASQAKDGSHSVFSPIISKVGQTFGKYIVTVASPVVVDNKFNGVLTIAIPLSSLTEKYIQNLKVLDSSRVYLITSQGEIVYSDLSELTGVSIEGMFSKDFLGREKVIDILSNELKKEGETKLKLAIPNFETNILESYLISTAPINISDQRWKLVIVTPEKDLIAFTYKTFSKQIIGVFVILVLFLGVTLRVSRNSGYEEAVIDEHKIHSLNKDHKKIN